MSEHIEKLKVTAIEFVKEFRAKVHSEVTTSCKNFSDVFSFEQSIWISLLGNFIVEIAKANNMSEQKTNTLIEQIVGNLIDCVNAGLSTKGGGIFTINQQVEF